MTLRSWSAVLVPLCVSACVGLAAIADDKPLVIVNHVNVKLRIDGVGSKGCEVEIKPGHAACKFRRLIIKYAANTPKDRYESRELPTIVAETSSADRECSFEIVVREEGKPEKTFVRGIRFSPRVSGEPVPVKSATFYLTAPSLAAKNQDQKKSKRQ